jgi:hypothetical protein
MGSVASTPPEHSQLVNIRSRQWIFQDVPANTLLAVPLKPTFLWPAGRQPPGDRPGRRTLQVRDAHPLVVEGRPCSKRIRKLQLPAQARLFGCRQCYGVTDTSSQESHQFDGLYRHTVCM